MTGYYRRFSLEEADAYLPATRVGGEALPHSHGHLPRLVAPGRKGVKWFDRIEVNYTGKCWRPPTPVVTT